MPKLRVLLIVVCALAAVLVNTVVNGRHLTRALGANAQTYVVQPGDTLSGIALSQGTTTDALAQANNVSNPDTIYAGEVLAIPGSEGSGSGVSSAGSTTTYTVQWGDTLSGIAASYGTDVASLMSLNNLSSDGFIQAGQQLIVPDNGSSATSSSGPTGYASGTTVQNMIIQEANAAGISPALVEAVAWQESGWTMVTATDGGMGVMQLMPDTVNWISSSLLGYQLNPYNLKDNIDGGIAMLKYCLATFSDTWTAVAAYHLGIAAVQNNGVSAEGASYANNVVALMQQFGG